MVSKILALPRATKRFISVATDFVLLSLAIWAAFALRYESFSWWPNDRQFMVSAVTVLVTIGAFVKLGLYRAVIRYLSEYAFLAILLGVGFSSVSLIVFGFLLQAPVPRSVPVILWSFCIYSGGGYSVCR